MKRKITKSQLSAIKKQRLFEQRISKSREKQFRKCYDVLAYEIESKYLKTDLNDFKEGVNKIIEEKFKPQLKLALSYVAELNIKEFIDYFLKVFKRTINVEELQVIESKMLNKFLNKYVGETVKNVSETTREIINSRITKYTQQGLSFRDIVKNIVSDTKGDIGVARAKIIARTETSKAISITNYTTAEKAGLKNKTWIYTYGSVTKRKFHEVMNGTIIPINDKFKVGGEGKIPSVELRFPKDPECRVPGQIISCSCQIFYS